MERRARIALGVIVGVVVLALVVLEFGIWLAFVDPGEYEQREVTVTSADGQQLATVDVRVADTSTKRTIGLSRTDELGPGEGMLFVHDRAQRHRYVMRGMGYPLDILFVDGNGTITEIHHADPAGAVTPESLMATYAGEGRYVLEVNRGWTNETGVAVGDHVAVSDDVDHDGGGTGDPPTPTATESPVGSASTETPDEPTVTAVDRNGTTLGSVHVRLADNRSERQTGLSETESLAWDEGMLFVYEHEGSHSFWMYNMSFAIDIVYVGSDGTVTEIHHANPPPPGAEESELERYPGTGQYVLEVNRGWTNETGLDVGDTVRVPESVHSDD